MEYEIHKNKIVLKQLSSFNARHILECGQIFTYEKLSENEYEVFSKDKKCNVVTYNTHVEIVTNDVKYFESFFDLKTNYEKIKQQVLHTEPNLKQMVEFGSGIRILKQEPLETIIGFIISANNNIKRIMASMKYIREKAGTSMGVYYAFPILNQLEDLDEEFFKNAGLGYRAKQMVLAIKDIKKLDLSTLNLLSTKDLKEKLLTIHGVGTKVADCILLFAYGRKDVFPVDTWIEKVYHDLFIEKEKNRDKMRDNLLERFGDLSGYVQQYAFYFKRSGNSD